MLTLPLPVIYLFVAVFSLFVGSFINVLIYRLPIILKRQWYEELCHFNNLPLDDSPKITLCFPRSFCPECKTTITAILNVPVLSYIALRRRCNHCQQLISIRYPLVETLSCILAVFSAWYFGITIQFWFSLLFIWLVLALFFIDLEHHLLPDCLTLSLLWVGLIANTQTVFTPLIAAVISAPIAYTTLWTFNKIFYLYTGKIGMGNGDFKLFAALGSWFGGVKLLLILLLSSIVGIMIGMVYLKAQKKSRNTPIPFGPFLCLSGLIFLFYGEEIINFYLNILGKLSY